MTADTNLANVTVALLTVVTVLGLTATAAGGAVATAPGGGSAQEQVTDSGSTALWGWWDDDDDDDDSPWWQDDSPWWEDDDDDEDDDSPWWEDDSPWWDDGDDGDDDDSGDGDDGDSGDGDDGDSGDDDNGTDDPAPAAFQLSGISRNSPVTAGETLTVDATVENTGEAAGTQTVDFAVDGHSDSQSVSLDAGASTTVSFEWTTQDGDAGDYTATVESANDTATTAVTVEAPAPEPDPANFDVSVAGTNSPVTEGETVEVTATVENTGDQDGTQTVELASSGTTLDSQDVTLAAGASQQVTLSWTTGAGDAGTHDLTVSSADASATTSVTVEAPAAPANFGVSVTVTNSPVTEGETLTVDATVENTGEQSGTQTVELNVAGGVQDSQSVTLGAGESQQVTLSWQTAEGDAGDYAATVSSDDASSQTDVSVEAATRVPSGFTSTVEDGYIQLGTGDQAYVINLTECPNGEAPSSDVECQTAVATVDEETGDFTIAREDLNFNTSVYVDQLATEVEVQMTAPNGLTGTTDWETGEATLSGDLEVVVPRFSDTCGASVSINATTGTQGSISGSAFNVSDGSPAEGTLVDGTYSVPAVTGCGSVLGLDLNTIANEQLGLPSDGGENRLVLDLRLEYDE